MTEINRTTKDISEEEKGQLMEQFRQSGLTYAEFAREHNVHEQTMKNWAWRENNPEAAKEKRLYSPTEKKKILESFLSTDLKQGEFCKAWGVSEASLSRWKTRYRESGADGLMPKARGQDDKRLGTKIPGAVKDEIIRIKKQKPEFGLKRIRQWLFRYQGMKVSGGSIRKTVKAEGLSLAIRPKKKKRSSDRIRRFERARAMQLWQSDITQFTLGQYWSRVYLTVFMDDHSRYIVGWKLMSRQTSDLVIDAFKDAVTRFGKPEEVLTDQGRQYFAWRGKSELEKLLDQEGIKHVVSRAHHPQTLGKCERFWETVANEFWSRAKPQELEEARVRLKHFIDHYNYQRPHQGLDGQVPADRFFGIAEEVRAAIEKTAEKNALKLALGELPKPPAFLIGQVGEQRIAFHGTSGHFYLAHENREGENNRENSRDESKFRSESDGKEIEAQAKAVDGGEISGDSEPRPLGESNDGGARAGANAGPGDHGLLDGASEEIRSSDEARGEADSILAADKASGSRNDGGTSHSAASEGNQSDDSPGFRINEASGEGEGSREDGIDSNKAY